MKERNACISALTKNDYIAFNATKSNRYGYLNLWVLKWLAVWVKNMAAPMMHTATAMM